MKRMHRLTALLLTCLLLASLLAASAVSASAGGKDSLLPGDLNGDGQRTVIDYIMLKRYVLGSYVIPEEFLPAADIDGNGKVGATDYMLLKRALMGTYALPAAPETPGSTDELPEEVQFAVAFVHLFRTADRDQLLQLEGELGFKLDTLNRLVVTYLATLSIEGDELLTMEEEITLPPPEEFGPFLRGLAAWLETLLP